MSKKILTLDNVPVINKKIGKIDTIEKLKASTIYSLGDVVEVLGFHVKGDGSHHKRVAKSEDDGSGELGVDGLIWCILHSGEVNVSWFGAKGDGVTDDTIAIQKSAIFNSNATTCFSNKTYKISDTIIFQNSNFQFKGIKGLNTKIIYEFNKPAILINGGSGRQIMKEITNIEFTGTVLSTGIEIKSPCGVFIRNCTFDTNRYGVKFSNDVGSGTFSEGNIIYNSRFNSNCQTALYYFKGVGDRSFHGSGLWDCWIDTKIENSTIEISEGALPYNAPMNFRLLTQSKSVINNLGSGDTNFYGNINIEGETPVLASGNRVLFVGNINGHGLYFNGTLVECEKAHTSGPAGANTTKIKSKPTTQRYSISLGETKSIPANESEFRITYGSSTFIFNTDRGIAGGNPRFLGPIYSNSNNTIDVLGITFSDERINFTPTTNVEFYITASYYYDIASKGVVVDNEN